jgi:hypothetical protein
VIGKVKINVHVINGNGLRQNDKDLMESKCVLGYVFCSCRPMLLQ